VTRLADTCFDVLEPPLVPCPAAMAVMVSGKVAQ
jgi:hypothetical protein